MFFPMPFPGMPNVMNLRIFQDFSGSFQGIFRYFPGVSGFFRVFFPMPFPGMPFGPFPVMQQHTLEFLAVPESALKIASEWRCAILVHSLEDRNLLK